MSRPNIILLVLDAVRIDHCSTYGYERETTPNMSALADDGVRYDQAFSPSIWTPTVHGAIFTGKYPSHTGIYGNSLSLPDNIETLPETLQKQGYRTFVASAGAHIRQDRGYARGVDDYVETRRIAPDLDFFRKVLSDPSFAKQVWLTLTHGPDDKTRYKCNRLQKFISRAVKDNQPFFGFINAKTAHQPFNPPRPYKEMFCERFERPRVELIERMMDMISLDTQQLPEVDIEKLRRVSQDGGDGVLAGEIDMTDEEWNIIEAWYDGAIRYLDDLVGKLMKFLKDCDAYEDTLIVLTSDHGNNFGDHGLTSHVFSLYDTLLHVPMIIKPPSGISNMRQIDEQVSLIDLYPTFIETAGAESSSYELTTSLLGFEQKSYHEYTLAEYTGFDGPIERLGRKYPNFDTTQFANPLQAIRDNEHKLIMTMDGNMGTDSEEDRNQSRELYAWSDDPHETTDIARDRPEIVDQLTTALRRRLPRLEAPGEFEIPDNPDLEAKLKNLGYL